MQSSYRNKRQTQRKIKIAIAITLTVISLLVIIYLCIGLYFKTHFFFRTEINGLNVGGMTTEEAEEKIARDADDYLLTIHDRDGQKHHIMGKDIGSSYKPDGSVGKALKSQKILTWLEKVFKGNNIDVDTPMNYKEDMLKSAVAGMDCFKEENITNPVNAEIKLTEDSFEIIPEIPGNRKILDVVIRLVAEAVTQGNGDITLDDDAYEKPAIASKGSEITQAADTLKKYFGAEIDYKMGDSKEVLEKKDIVRMLKIEEDYSITFIDQRITDFVQQLATKYNTYGDMRNFKTSSGDIVEIGGGDYGWVIHKEREAETLKANIMSGEKVTREPEYSQRAKVEGLEDIGDTYVEIDYTKQHMWYYEKGQMVLECDIVSGNIALNNGSPDGVFKVVYKQSPAVLKGEDYESNVNYFMPFAYNVGIHDASWRTQFGGESYKTAGSHGCINAPGDVAAALYQKIAVDTPVIAYYREKVELTAENCKISNAYSYVEPPKEEQ